MNRLFELWSLVSYLIVQGFGLVLAGIAAVIFLYIVLRKLHSARTTIVLIVFFVGAMLFFWFPIGVPKNLTYPFGIKTYGPGYGPTLPLKNVFEFFRNLDKFERVADIARNPLDVPPPTGRTEEAVVKIELTAKEVLSEIAPGVILNYWTFDGTVPGPMLRVREGDTIELTLHNAASNLHMHSIDLHAVTGPGGGATVTDVMPGESKTMRFKALNPGLYVYHCAHQNVANHMAHGMYGLILVEPKEGLPAVDRELYVMQGEFYTGGARGTKGLQVIDTGTMLDGNPAFVVFNGRVGSISKDSVVVKQGEKVRMYVGNGGVNLISSFHLIGEIFDTVYPEAQMGGTNFKNVQTTLVPAGGAAITEFTADIPGTYVLVDHALARMDKGAWGTLSIVGDARPDIFSGDSSGDHSGH
ncbi:nitrite reductase, copper-containing [Candidatus Kaiserbacteria bacterium RIFCSPHIGHO2_01_FULL_56_24]|uniref:Copper-containing nitrite reductase n=1 Tax=Candidatus Kaiserbacteria bacterium RIFCSPHIGHO2_01_FULL_56_24 TaxID=1798487 RepID=A0A1F6DEL9_9BACT|nr:MAG: nitrite reductase, copper-containing [Candidatus Kaiserbacteria bacterium RIFCSPHIGHO2_01_FULL_56_24]